MDYHTYIGSAQWQAKRQQRIEFDDHRCAICHHDGSVFSLSVHHLHYESLGDEDVIHDLLTAFSQCHRWLDSIERFQRYNRRQRVPDILDTPIQERNSPYGMAESTVSVDISLPNVDAQWEIGKSPRQVRKSYETDIIEARQDRF